MELKWQMRAGDSSSRLCAGPRAHCNTMNAPLPPFYLHSRLLLQHPFRRSLLAARRQGVHSGWCMPSLKDTQGSHTSCPEGQSSWRSLPSHPFLVLQPGVTLQGHHGLPGRAHPSCFAPAAPSWLQVLNWGQPGKDLGRCRGPTHSLGSISSCHPHFVTYRVKKAKVGHCHIF